MPIANKTRLAVAALLELARQTQPQPLPHITRRLRVSVSYLELLFGRMRRYGLVHSTRGPGGGYRLARSTAAISVLDVVAAVEGWDADPSRPARPGRQPDKPPAPGRIDSDWWKASEHEMAAWLAAVSLHDLVEADRSARPLPLAA